MMMICDRGGMVYFVRGGSADGVGDTVTGTRRQFERGKWETEDREEMHGWWLRLISDKRGKWELECRWDADDSTMQRDDAESRVENNAD